MSATKSSTASYMATAQTMVPKWFVIDVDGMVVGRVATQIATVLMGKHKPEYTPHVECGDFVIVLNADKVRFSGARMGHKSHPYYSSKMSQKTYDWVTGYPGGRRVVSAIDLWSRKPEEILRQAVKRMLPKNKLGPHMLKKLKLYVGTEHPHQAQGPVPFPEYLIRS